MFKNYLKIAFRNLWRRKGFSFINITGLAIGMASAVLILLWIQNELGYDSFHKNKDRLYEVWNRGTYDGKLQCWDNTPKILAKTLKLEYPGIEEAARTDARWFVTAVGDKKISSRALIVDPCFLTMFSFPMLKGQPSSALNNVYSIVITEAMGKKMFGDADPMNKTINIDKDHFTVTGVVKNLPTNSSFDFEYILPWAYYTKLGNDDSYWGNNSTNTYLLLKPGTGEAYMDAQIRETTIRHSNGEVKEQLFLHPLAKWHLYSDFENGKIVGGRIDTVRLFGIIAAFILLIACINFMNLSTARSEKRAKEVGIRKVSGAHKGLLIGQFLGESILIAGIAAVLALVLVEVFRPSFDLLVNKQLTVPYDSPWFWGLALLFILLTGAIAGSYPAFFISSFKPVAVLKGNFKKAQAAVNPRKVLVVLQFSFAIVLIICTLIVSQQIRYAQDREIGYKRGQRGYHWTTGNLNNDFSALKNDLLAQGIASYVTRSSAPLGGVNSDSWDFRWEGKDPNDKTDFLRYNEDEGLVKTAGLILLQGRDMDLSAHPADSDAVLLNESAVKAMKFKNPVGQLIREGGKDVYHVIGVIKDFVVGSPYDPTRPMIIEGAKKQDFNVITMKLDTVRSTAQNLQLMETLFKKYNPEYPFEYHFVDKDFALQFSDTQRIATLTALFAGLTIFISCLGLFGLAAYMAENRVKEIGVRKVLGASAFRITALLSREFLTLVLVSICIAAPVSWYAMHTWLQNYSYRTSIDPGIFLLAGLLSVVISLLTVSYQTIKAALANPTKSLRSE